MADAEGAVVNDLGVVSGGVVQVPANDQPVVQVGKQLLADLEKEAKKLEQDVKDEIRRLEP